MVMVWTSLSQVTMPEQGSTGSHSGKSPEFPRMYPQHIRTKLSQMKQYESHTYNFPGLCGKGGISSSPSHRRKSTHRYFSSKTKQNSENMNAENGKSNKGCFILLSCHHQAFCQILSGATRGLARHPQC